VRQKQAQKVAGEIDMDDSQIYLDVYPRDKKGRVYGTGDAAHHFFPRSYSGSSTSTQSSYTPTPLARATAENAEYRSRLDEIQRQLDEEREERRKTQQMLELMGAKLGISFPTHNCNTGPGSRRDDFGDDGSGGSFQQISPV
jgi:hypothetical protein